jgi:hypothetical protein
MDEGRALTYGMAIGAGLMFLLDPRRGSARRTLVRQKAIRAAHEIERAAAIGARDLEHRAQGLAARAKRFGTRDEATDDVLVARVRAALGRSSSHPHAIEVIAKGDGCVELKGPVLADELDEVLSHVSSVRGVRAVDDDLEVHEQPDVPGLQGPPRVHRRAPRLSPAARFMLGAGAAGLGIAALIEGHPLGFIASGAVALLLGRSIVHRGAQRQRPAAGGLREAYPPPSEWAPVM